MKVLHLPANIASQMSTTVRALRDIGIDARGLIKKAHVIENAQSIEVLPSVTAKRYSVNRVLQKICLWRAVIDAIKWADVIHWHYKNHLLPMEFDLRYASLSNKACIVEFWGSDIRIPEMASADNPYTARMYELHPELADGRRQRSIKTQRKFHRYGFECLVPDDEMATYVQKNLWPSPYRTKQRIILSDFEPQYPDPFKKCPLIVHTPSHKGKKGTDVILKAIEQLSSTYDFEFQLVHGLEHRKALEIMRNADIVIDEVTSGAYGLAAIEAMALGTPTICYIKPSLILEYPDSLPIVNANQKNITTSLAGLLENGEKRHEIGRLSRAYAEKFHSSIKIAQDLVIIYQELLEKVRKSASKVSRCV